MYIYLIAVKVNLFVLDSSQIPEELNKITFYNNFIT